jgi:ABC-type transport system involved in resistance to organic solvents, periplasmic component
MKTRINPALVGVFVIGALILGVAALLTFGGVNFFSKPQRFVVYFDESVGGLDLGSPVKLRGLRVGRVVDLTVRYDQERRRSLVAVVCEFSRNVMRDARGAEIDVSNRDQLQALVDKGLRAQLGVMGIATGLLYIELDFVDEEDDVPIVVATIHDPRYVEVPAMPSAIAAAQASVTEILANLQRVDFPGLAQDVRALITDTRRQLNKIDITEVTAEWAKAGRAVTALAESPRFEETLVNLNGAINDLKKTLAGIDQQVVPAGEQLAAVLEQAKGTLKTFESAAANARAFIAAQGGLGEEATRTLMQLSDAALSVQRLSEFLERNPSALITGRNPGK